MVTRKTGLLSAVAALPFIAALAGAQAAGREACAASPAVHMIAFDTAKVASLVGGFDVVMIDTTSLRGGIRQHKGKLMLFMQDSIPRRRASSVKRVKESYLVGTFEAALPDSGEMWSSMMSRTVDAPGVFWTDGFLRMGEFGPKSGISLHVRSITEDEFRGMWTSHAGTIIVDFTGAREPDEAGYFCARRLK